MSAPKERSPRVPASAGTRRNSSSENPTARSAVLAYILHEDGIDLNGVTLLSSILDYSQAGNPIGLLPTLADG